MNKTLKDLHWEKRSETDSTVIYRYGSTELGLMINKKDLSWTIYTLDDSCMSPHTITQEFQRAIELELIEIYREVILTKKGGY